MTEDAQKTNQRWQISWLLLLWIISIPIFWGSCTLASIWLHSVWALAFALTATFIIIFFPAFYGSSYVSKPRVYRLSKQAGNYKHSEQVRDAMAQLQRESRAKRRAKEEQAKNE